MSTNKLGVVAWGYDPSYVEGINRRTVVQAGLGKNMRPYSKKQKKITIIV
jgi:hypothetical protein